MAKVPIQASELNALANDRFTDAETLFNNNRDDGAIYMCGYVMELALKKAICSTLGWSQYPYSKDGHFNGFYTHSLETLLALSGKESFIKLNHFADWSIVASWDPGMRYTTTTTPFTHQQAQDMLTSTQKLRSAL